LQEALPASAVVKNPECVLPGSNLQIWDTCQLLHVATY
jgi:hypothetical protein